MSKDISKSKANPLTDLTRRSILLGAAATAPVALSAISSTKAFAQASRKDVLVIGAGMAGLTAALSLSRRGHKVTIIEYQNRIGGRLLSLPLGGGQFSEAGGGHFRSNMPYAVRYIHKFKLPLIALNDGLPKYFLDGKSAYAWDLADRPWPLSQEERNVTIASSLIRYLSRAGLDTDTVLGPRWPSSAMAEALDEVTIGDLLRHHGASEAFCKLFGAHEGRFVLDAVALAAVPTLAYHLGSPALFRIAGGNNRLPMAMATAIGSENIVLGEQVTSIDDTGARVRVATKTGKEFRGDAVISTIPFSVIDEVKVTPGWSANKRKMFQKMGWGNTVKIVVQTQKPKWLSYGAYGWPMAGGDRPWERVIDITGNEGDGHGNIFFYLNGPNADAVLAEPPASRGDAVISQFQADMPDMVTDVIAKQSFAWSEQPWIKGSFGHMPIGGAWMMKEWAMPEGRIYFAGDFTTLKTGWVEGAIESGLRAARQIDAEAPIEGNPATRSEQKI